MRDPQILAGRQKVLHARLSAGMVPATPTINGATVTTRTFNDCPL